MTCPHPRLTFGSAGFYVVCVQCQAMWRAVLPSGEADPSRMRHELTRQERPAAWADPDEQPTAEQEIPTGQHTPAAKGLR